jgi:hypothetical protein
MTATVAIDTLVVTAPSAVDARRLADALPAALERAILGAAGRTPVAAATLNAGAVHGQPHAHGLADRVAAQIVAAVMPGAGP